MRLVLDKKFFKYYVALFIAVAVNLFLFSSTSPIHSILNLQYDEVTYNLMGKGIKYGRIPYIDLSDHKGIYLYIVYALANIISETNHIGMFVVSVFIFYAIALFAFKISYLLLKRCNIFDDSKNIILSFLCSFIIYFISNTYYFSFGGLDCETVISPLLLFAYYQMLKYILNEDNKHSIKYIFIDGILAGIILYVKANALICLLPIAVFLLIDLIIKKEYKCLLLNALFGFLGVVVGILPGTIYLIATGSFKAMVDEYFLVNMLYVNAGLPSETSKLNSFYQCIDEFKEYMFITIISPALLYTILRNYKKIVTVRIVIFSTFTLIFAWTAILMPLRSYSHYLDLVTFNIFIFVFFILVNVFKLLSSRKTLIVFTSFAFIIVNVLSYGLNLEISNINGFIQHKLSKEAINIYSKYDYESPKLLVVGNEPILYEAFNVLPSNKVFIIPVVNRKDYSKPYDELLQHIEKHNEEYIILSFSRYLKTDKEYLQMVYGALANNYENIGSVKFHTNELELFIRSEQDG